MISRKNWILVVLVATLLLNAGCAIEEDHWESAKASDTTEAYASFLERYPDGRYSSEARNLLRNHFRELHVEAFAALGDDDLKRAKELYGRILRMDPKNSLALNNLVYFLGVKFYDGRTRNQKAFSTRDKGIIMEMIDLLGRAQLYANRRRVAGTVTGMVFQGDPIYAAQPPTKESKSTSLRGLVRNNLEPILKIQDMPYTELPVLEDLLIKGTVTNASSGTPIAGQKLWLLEGKWGEKNGTSEDQDPQMQITESYDKNGKLLSPTATSDEHGDFTFRIDSEADLFADKSLIIAAAEHEPRFQTKFHLLLQNGRPLVFYPELDGREMTLGQLTMKKGE